MPGRTVAAENVGGHQPSLTKLRDSKELKKKTGKIGIKWYPKRDKRRIG